MPRPTTARLVNGNSLVLRVEICLFLLIPVPTDSSCVCLPSPLDVLKRANDCPGGRHYRLFSFVNSHVILVLSLQHSL